MSASRVSCGPRAWVAMAAAVWCAAAGYASAGDDWAVLRGKHFLVHYRGDRTFAERVAARAENERERIGGLLGHRAYGGYWLWDRRVKVFLHASREAFGAAQGAPSWAVGKASYERMEVHGIEGSGAFLESVLPHELAHLLLREFVGHEGEIPLWLDEGFAQCAEDGAVFGGNHARGPGAGFPRSQAVALADFFRVDVRRVESGELANRYYRQAASLVAFLLTEYGGTRFRDFCRELRRGRPVEEALRLTYPPPARTIEGLEATWKRSLGGMSETGKR